MFGGPLIINILLHDKKIVAVNATSNIEVGLYMTADLHYKYSNNTILM